jgi:hypothetical protein
MHRQSSSSATAAKSSAPAWLRTCCGARRTKWREWFLELVVVVLLLVLVLVLNMWRGVAVYIELFSTLFHPP